MNITEQQKIEILCAYLPYRIGVEWIRPDDNKKIVSELTISDYLFLIRRHNGQPILRHRDDMTEEEQHNYIELWEDDSNFIQCATKCLQYLHSLHIDTFGAIESGFAVRKAIKP